MKRVFAYHNLALALVALFAIMAWGCGDDSTGSDTCPEGTIRADDGSCVPIMADGDDTDTAEEAEIIEQEVVDGDIDKDLEDTDVVDEADPDPEPDIEPDPECTSTPCATEGYICNGATLQQCQNNTLDNGCIECTCSDTEECDYGCTDAGQGIAYCNDAPDGDVDEEEEIECSEIFEDLRECRGDELWECSSVNPPPCGGCYLVRTCDAGRCIDIGEGTAYCDTPVDGDETDTDESDVVCDTCTGSGECTVQGFVCEGDNLNHCSTETVGPAECECYNCACTLSSACQYGCTDPGNGLATCNDAPVDGDEVDPDDDVNDTPCVCLDDTDCLSSYYCDGCHCVLRPDGDIDEADNLDFVSCQSDTDCPTGYYCGGTNYCIQDCIDDTDCPQGFVCTDRGYCTQPSDLDFDVVDVPDVDETDGTGCNVHPDCPEYMYCKFSTNECRIGSRCMDPADCVGNPAGESCVDGTCTQ